MTLGRGSNIKVAEAIAAKLPILSTDFGMRGFNVTREIDYVSFTRENLEIILKSVVCGNTKDMLSMAENLRERLLATIDSEMICDTTIRPIIEKLS